MSHLGVVTLLAVTVGADTTVTAPGTDTAGELWAGRQVVRGRRAVPLLGDRETRTESWVLARVRRDEAGLELVQRACRVDSAPVLGVTTRIEPRAARALPPVRFRLARDPANGVLTGAWAAGFDAFDWDGDGAPGLSVGVAAPLCSGSVAVTSETTTRARASEEGDMLTGEVTVEVRQHVLAATARCLLFGGRDTRDEQRGDFVYVRVPAGTTCDDLAPDLWP